MILNLDKLIKDDKILILNGAEIKIPADLPVKFILRMQAAAQEIQKDQNSIENIMKSYDIMYDIIAIRNPDFISREDFRENITMSQYIALCNFITGVETAPEDENKKKDDSGNTQNPLT
jgi:hypothetical protein